MDQNTSSATLQATSQQLNKRGFDAQAYANKEQAAQAVLDQIPPGSTVGIGGSVTIQAMQLSSSLKAQGCTVFWHWNEGDETAARKAAFQADYYLLSANALGENGIIYNIDGTGNRVAATQFGPAKVLMVIGRNKLINGGYEQALARIHQVACPQNARRLGLKTPCAITGKCTDCKSPQRMCAITAILEKRPNAKPFFKVLLVDEDLGY